MKNVCLQSAAHPSILSHFNKIHNIVTFSAGTVAIVVHMKCPTCQSEVSQRGTSFVCPEHGLVQTGTNAVDQQRVFISYGREDALDFAKQLATDLEACGYH